MQGNLLIWSKRPTQKSSNYKCNMLPRFPVPCILTHSTTHFFKEPKTLQHLLLGSEAVIIWLLKEASKIILCLCFEVKWFDSHRSVSLVSACNNRTFAVNHFGNLHKQKARDSLTAHKFTANGDTNLDFCCRMQDYTHKSKEVLC